MKRKMRPMTATALGLALLSLAILTAVKQVQSQQSPNLGSQEATNATLAVNAANVKSLPFDDTHDFEDAQRGLIAKLPGGIVKGAGGNPIWNLNDYAFLEREEPSPTVNASLWRQSRLNMNNGLFRVTDRIFQVRGVDLSNLTIIEGDSGLILIDPLISQQTSKAALALYHEHRPKRPVRAVIYSHSHVDHYGGAKGVVSEEDVKAGKVQILAPQGFLEHAVSENVYAGNAMGRRATYMYGVFLPRSDRGQVDAGLGKATSLGSVTLIPPTDIISKDGDTRVIDGVEIHFQLAPGTEAPAEMLMYFPQFKALCAAEDATHTLHNLYTLRGAEVRDTRAWWKALHVAIDRFGDKSEVVFAQHHWPTWGQDRVLAFLKSQRDTYKYLHDQVLRLANRGETMNEIAEDLKLPESLARAWSSRGYYGSVSHDAKAIYQKYLGWYDSNPSHLNPLPPVDAAKKYVDFMGGAAAVIAKARESYRQGEYRWVAEVLNHVVFADPKNQEARLLEADALEQLGYQTENATWRNEYLVGAFELRHGIPKSIGAKTDSADVIEALPLDMYFEYLGIRLNGPKAEGKTISLNWNFTDVKSTYALVLENSVLIPTAGKTLPNADASVTLTRKTLDAIAIGTTSFPQAIADGSIKVEGDRRKLAELLGLLDSFEPMFPIVTP